MVFFVSVSPYSSPTTKGTYQPILTGEERPLITVDGPGGDLYAGNNFHLTCRDAGELMEIKDLVIDDRQRGLFKVHRSSMTSPELFQREQELIFNQCWIYLGHESEVESAGDYRRRTVAGRPLFFVRGRDGQVRVFLNSCPHRGAQICRRDTGVDLQHH